MNKYAVATLAGIVLAASACKDNPAAPSVDRVVAGSQQTLQSLVTGVVAEDRLAVGSAYFRLGGVMARDAIVPSANEPRNVTEFYETQPDPSGFGAGLWNGFYTTIRAAHNLLNDPAITSLSAGNAAAARGFLRTLIALEYIRLIEYRDQNGIVIQGDDPTVLDPIRTKQSALASTSALLDSALTDLNSAAAAGAKTVPFVVPPGYQLHGDYSQVSNLMLLNRGLEGKAEVFRALDAVSPQPDRPTVAIAAFNRALSDAPSPVTKEYLNRGPWYQYNPGAPESFSNPLGSITFLVTDNFVNSIMPGDARRANIIPAPKQTVKDSSYVGSNRIAITDPTNPANQTAPLPIIRNGEFYLLRAQAEISVGDLPGATRDINVVHTVEGGLPAYGTFASASAAITAVLYEFRYSFAYMGPQHLDALREYKMLNLAYVSQPGIPTPKGGGDALVQQLPIPQTEANARGGNVTPVP
ncbi:MAG: hypothetical protein ACR2MQ_10505 [Gemmatimonadaceae bacterium]